MRSCLTVRCSLFAQEMLWMIYKSDEAVHVTTKYNPVHNNISYLSENNDSPKIIKKNILRTNHKYCTYKMAFITVIRSWDFARTKWLSDEMV